MSLMLQHVYPDDHLVGTGTDHPLREPLHRVHFFIPVRQKKGDAYQLGPQDFADYSGCGGEMGSTEANYLRPAATAQFEAVADQFLGGGSLCPLG